jgi:hypothetical protein
MAERNLPAVSRPVPTFSGSKREDVSSFIEAIQCAHERERACYDDETAPMAKKSLLVEGCKGKAAKFVKNLSRDQKDTTEHLVTALRAEYESPNVEDRARSFQKAMKLHQKSDEDLATYARRAKKLAGKVEAAYDKVVATQFVRGIRSKHIRVMVAANSQSNADYTFKDVYQAVKAVARARRDDSGLESESDSSSSSSSSSAASGSDGAWKHHYTRKYKESTEKESKGKEAKVPEVEIKSTTLPNGEAVGRAGHI